MAGFPVTGTLIGQKLRYVPVPYPCLVLGELLGPGPLKVGGELVSPTPETENTRCAGSSPAR